MSLRKLTSIAAIAATVAQGRALLTHFKSTEVNIITYCFQIVSESEEWISENGSIPSLTWGQELGKI